MGCKTLYSNYVILLRSDGKVDVFGPNSKELNITDPPPGVKYTQIGCGEMHLVLIMSNGNAVGFGSNKEYQCNIPYLPEGVIYTQVAAGRRHTVLLRSDGTAIAFGDNGDGTAIAFGDNGDGQFNIPDLPEGVIYTQVSAGSNNTMLLRSDGKVVVSGSDINKWNIPNLEQGVNYTQVSVSGYHAVLLRSDGKVETVGENTNNQCDIPELSEGLWYGNFPAKKITFQFVANNTIATSFAGSGKRIINIDITPNTTIRDIWNKLSDYLNTRHLSIVIGGYINL